MNEGLAVRAADLGKGYRRARRLSLRLRDWVHGREAGPASWALRAVSFELRRGQSLGVIGDNGAGKTTLLALIAGAAAPTTGTITTHGSRTALLELGAGFHRDFTGRENLMLAGLAAGLDRATLRRREADIIEFAGVGAAIDTPLRTWSSGMVLRLAFAAATASLPDILVIDEALAVGDQRFQARCLDRIEIFRRGGGTLIFCSHNLYQVKKLCDLALWLEAGRPRLLGPAAAVVDAYADASRERRLDGELGREPGAAADQGRALARVVHVEVALADGRAASLVETGDTVVLRVSVELAPDADIEPGVAVGVVRADGLVCHCISTEIDGARMTPGPGRSFAVELRLDGLPLLGGRYHFNVAAIDQRRPLVLLDVREGEAPFFVVNSMADWGVSRLPHVWTAPGGRSGSE